MAPRRAAARTASMGRAPNGAAQCCPSKVAGLFRRNELKREGKARILTATTNKIQVRIACFPFGGAISFSAVRRFSCSAPARNALAQSAPAMTPHEKELYEAAKKEGGELTWYTAQSDDITAQALGRSFESPIPASRSTCCAPPPRSPISASPRKSRPAPFSATSSARPTSVTPSH